MVAKKKVVKRKTVRKKVHHRAHIKERVIIREKLISPKESNTEKALIENFVSLQRVMVNLSVKFDSLTGQISKLLELFEISAKSLAEKDVGLEKSNRDTKVLLEKMDNMFDQNKTIAQGLTLMHDKIEDRIPGSSVYEPPKTFPKPPQVTALKPMSNQVPKQVVKQNFSEAEYKKSISSKSPELP